ncbi:MFS transporter [Actinotalea sp. M2MS4P-6]|uniref:MFS transporter n=1 Tax=Actinotalea sp. M2MS4P-6 TaxID=2983762 RepID=UPI0021E4715B|nr:MFS transporter [Actinotalea sp. M2MS4P-6]MCV2395200.1 MFS transporter [Actinotalea sp. M2MS4P-6]
MTVDNTSPTSPGTPHRWWALAAVALGVSLIIMDATVVNVALPVVIEDLGLSATQAEWMNAVYSLMLAALLLTVGRVGDLYGRRRIFAIGMTVFVLASVAAGAAGSGAVLIAARLVQGAGAAMILPATLSTLNAVFTGRERGIAFAVWGSTIGGMAAVGPLVGGWLTTDVSWRWAFWLSVPVGLAVLAGIATVVPETKDETTAPGLDWAGVLLSTFGMGAIVFALIESRTYGWWLQDSGSLSPIPVALAAGVALMVGFVAVQRTRRRAGRVVLVDLSLLGVRSFRYGSIAALIVALGEFGLIFTLPLLLQNALGYTALQTGWLIVSLAIGTFLISGATPQLTARLGGRTVVRLGLALEAVAVAGLAITLTQSLGSWGIAGWLFLYGTGVGMATAQLTSVILAEIPVAESGQASGLQSTFRQLGSALGVAVLGTVLLTTLGTSTDTHLADAGVPDPPRGQLVEAVTSSAGSVIPSLQADPSTAVAGDAGAAALVHASKITTGAAAAVITVGLAATWALPYVPPAPHDPGPRDTAAEEPRRRGGRRRSTASAA